ncbi:TIGR03545 family protein [bacterium]|nr:TIGR03545 family protein [bacterium]
MRWIRWKGLIPLLVIIALVVVVSLFFMDKWMETGIEKTMEAVTGARVEMDGFHFNLFKMTLKWDRLQVADPRSTMQNIIETDRTAFRMNTAAMLRKRTVIEEMTLSNLRTGTQRKTDGALPRKPEKPKADSRPGPFDKLKAQMAERVAKLPVLQFDPSSIKRKLNLDSLIAVADLKMPARLDSSKHRVMAVSADWENFYKGFRPDNDLEKIRNDFNSIDPGKLKTVPELMSALDKVQAGQKTLKAIQDTIRTRRDRIKTDFDQLKGYAASLDDWYKEDFHSVMALAKLPDLSVRNIGMMLFGKSMVHEIDRILGIVQAVRSYMPKKSGIPEKEKPQRMKGQDILFPSRHAWPKFLIRKVNVSGQTGETDEAQGLMLTGEASDITSQPWVIGRPTKLSLNGKKGDGRSLSLTGNLDHTKDIESDQFHFKMDRVSLNNFGLAESDYLPKTIKKGLADVNVNADFTGGRTAVRLAVAARGLDFDFPEQASANKFVDITRDVMRRMDLITLDTRLIEEGGKSDFRMDSNLDERISAELKAMGSQALAEAEGKIRGRLDGMVSGKRTELNGLYGEKRGLIEGKIQEYEKKADELRMAVDAKIEKIKADIEARKKQEEDKLKKGAKNLLDGMLK